MHKLGSKEFVETELARAFQSWTPYTNLKFLQVDDYHAADIRVVFGRYHHGDRWIRRIVNAVPCQSLLKNEDIQLMLRMLFSDARNV